MVSTRKKRQSSRRLLSQLDDFDQDMVIGNAVSERQENTVVNEGTNDRDFTAGTSSNNSVVNGNEMSVKTLERRFNERIDREMSNIIDTVEDRIQNAILTAIDNIVAPKIELAFRSKNASSGRDVTSVSAKSERREHVGINASFGNASGNNDTLGVSNANDETRHIIPDEVSELSVPETHFDRQPHTHHRLISEKSCLPRHSSKEYCSWEYSCWETKKRAKETSETLLKCEFYCQYKKFNGNLNLSKQCLLLHKQLFFFTHFGWKKVLKTLLQKLSEPKSQLKMSLKNTRQVIYWPHRRWKWWETVKFLTFFANLSARRTPIKIDFFFNWQGWKSLSLSGLSTASMPTTGI